MGGPVFNNPIFDSWLTKKAEEILLKANKDGISNEEMLILVLKAQTNHFHHVDMEFRNEFKSIREEFKDIREESKAVRKEYREEFKAIRLESREEFKSVRKEMVQIAMWQIGIMITLFAGLYLKLFWN